MKIKWLGHASFLITSEGGTRIITDPYETNERIKYGQIKEPADVVTVSHGHSDHANVAAVQGKPAVVKGTAEAGGIKFRGIAAHHDETGGSQRGSNIMFCFEVDGVRICHLGDLGHPLSQPQVKELGAVDVLMVPVGGFFTIDAKTASQLVEQVKPKVIIPMHYSSDRCALPIAPVDDFLKGKANVSRLDSSEVEFKKGALPAGTRIMVLKPAL